MVLLVFTEYRFRPFSSYFYDYRSSVVQMVVEMQKYGCR